MIKVEDINKKKKLKREIFIFCVVFFLLIVSTVGLMIYSFNYDTHDIFKGIVYGLLGTVFIALLALSIAIRFKDIYSIEIEQIVKSYSNKRTSRQELIKAAADTFNLKIPTNHKVVMYMIALDRLNDVSLMFSYEKKELVVEEFRNRVENILEKNETLAMLEDNSIVLLSVSDSKTVDEKLKLLKNKIQQTFIIEDQEINLKVHIGVVIQKKENWHNADTFINKAHVALQHASFSEDSKVVIYKDSLTESMHQMFNAESLLRKAIINREFSVAYQPKVNTSFKVVGAEALFRWKNLPEGYTIGSIIELAENKGFIDDISKIIFEMVFQDIKKWEKQGRNYKIAMNLSPKTLNDPDFVTWFKNLMITHAVNPAMVEIEITETALIDNFGKALDKINQIKDLGCSIAIDDFGVGHSSLSNLVNIPFDILKIDRSFITPLSFGNEHPIAVVSSIIHLAHKMGCKVVAEGVETEEQLKILQNENCDMIQGYLFSKPIKAEEFDIFVV